jgi:hypothetical protein
MKTKRDEPLEEIWAIRRKISARYDHDPRKQAEDLKKRQTKLKARFFRPAEAASKTG